MKTPICDFVKSYKKQKAVRLHMPGHKGKKHLGAESYDITEIGGADVLYSASGIIKESADNATALFGSGKTLYSTEGSSLCIRAMLLLIKKYAESRGERPLILAGRNAHKTFLSAAALLDVDVEWLFSAGNDLLSCRFDMAECENLIVQKKVSAVYVTSPDYLGNLTDIAALSALCQKHSVLLAVDNAHGAYLKFLPNTLHPLDLGADLVCDSAHKTLPVLTGGAYLHISQNAPELLKEEAERALSLFASTSPSYLILQSLDHVNRLLAGVLPKKLNALVWRTASLKTRLSAMGYTLVGDEPLKLTLTPKSYGYTGVELAELLEGKNIICEFCDPDFLVFMLSADTSNRDLSKLEKALSKIPRKVPIATQMPHMDRPISVLPLRDALLATGERVPITKAEGRILSDAAVSCPPAVPILVSGEKITKEAIDLFSYYGMDSCLVIKKD